MKTGAIIFFATNGYGFIKQDDSEDNLFYHFSALPDPTEAPQTGQRVSFDIEEGRKGKQACNIKYIS